MSTPLALLPAQVRCRHTDDGGLVLASPAAPGAPVRAIGDWLVRWAAERPAATLLAERRPGGGWTRWTYADALAAVEAIAAALLARGADPARPVMILSDNSVTGALIGLAAMHIGVPVAPVSPAYAAQAPGFRRLSEVTAQLVPGFVYADDLARAAPAIAAVQAVTGAAVHVLDDVAAIVAAGPRAVGDARQAFARIAPDTIAKVLFTSGSTGTPKGVVNTHRMLTANQESLAACWPFLATTPPVIVDWLPWSHTFGGNHNFHLVLRNGGSLFIDRGRPVPGMIEATIANLAEISPTIWFNVPRGFDQAVALLEDDPAAAARVFARLDVVFYAAAALGPTTRSRLERVAAAA
jgi:feruloyl-CoA synthase